MKFLAETKLTSKSYRECDLWDGELIIWGRQTWKRKFPIYYTEENKENFEKMLQKEFGKRHKLKFWYLQKYAEYRKHLEYMEWHNNYQLMEIDIPNKKYARRIYKANLFVLWGFTNSYSQATSKVRVIDVDTWAYYSLWVEECANLLHAIMDGSATFKDGIITAEVYPHAKGGTCFLGVYSKALKQKEAEAQKKTADKNKKLQARKVKKKDLVVGKVYQGADSRDKFIYMWYGTVEQLGKRREGYIRLDFSTNDLPYGTKEPYVDFTVKSFANGKNQYGSRVTKTVPTLYEIEDREPKWTFKVRRHKNAVKVDGRFSRETEDMEADMKKLYWNLTVDDIKNWLENMIDEYYTISSRKGYTPPHTKYAFYLSLPEIWLELKKLPTS